jgi:hypothetical protein
MMSLSHSCGKGAPHGESTWWSKTVQITGLGTKTRRKRGFHNSLRGHSPANLSTSPQPHLLKYHPFPRAVELDIFLQVHHQFTFLLGNFFLTVLTNFNQVVILLIYLLVRCVPNIFSLFKLSYNVLTSPTIHQLCVVLVLF